MVGEEIFLLVSDTCDDPWEQLIRSILFPFGTLQICSEYELQTLTLQQYRLIIIDAASVRDVVRLILHVLAKKEDAKVVVATATPSWKQAREVFYAGAIDYIRKVSSERKTLSIVETALEKANRIR